MEKQNVHTILIVEDEDVNYLYLETLLEYEIELNCKTIHAENGKIAVDICKNGLEIDLILMDLRMPVMTGFEATRQIKEFLPDIPIVVQTAYSTREDREKAFSAGCDDFIVKPISRKAINKVTTKYLINDQIH